MSKIVVFGIPGYAGSAIASELLDRGHHVVGIARNPGEVAPREHLEVLSGSVHDPALLSEVAKGAEAIVLAVRVLQDDGAELATTVQALLKAAADSGARIGVVGGAASLFVAEGGPRVIDAGFPEEYRAEAEAHGRVLDALQSADTTVDWFYVSPPFGFGAHNPGTKTGTFRLGTDVLVTDADGNADISGSDFATAIADEIEACPSPGPFHHGLLGFGKDFRIMGVCSLRQGHDADTGARIPRLAWLSRRCGSASGSGGRRLPDSCQRTRRRPVSGPASGVRASRAVNGTQQAMTMPTVSRQSSGQGITELRSPQPSHLSVWRTSN